MKQNDILGYWRVWLVVLVLAVLPALLSMHVYGLLIGGVSEQGVSLKNEGDDRTLRTEKLDAYRGLITDRNGDLLAVSTPVTTIIADPFHLKDKDVPALAKLLGLTQKEIKDKVARYQGKRFMYLKEQMPPYEAEAVLKKRFSGVYGKKEFKRFYPAGEVTSHLLGITSKEEKGQEGIELSFDEWLAGEPGQKRVLKDRKQNVVKELELLQAPHPGSDLQLTIDLKLQYLAYKELKHAIAKQGAKSGWLVTADARTGEILAMVNQPAYNPNDRSTIKPWKTRNRAVTDVFEPGSTVKPFTVAAALETKRFNKFDTIDTSPGYVRVQGKSFLDPVNYGVMDLAKILKKSSQVGITKIALKMQPDEIREMYFKLGLGQPTGVGFPGERAGSLPSRSRWTDVERANFAFGYGLNVNSLQLVQAYLALANEGRSRPLSLIKSDELQPETQVLDSRVAKDVSAMLKGVTQKGGTATRAAIADYSVAGKTGTAHKVNLNSGGYADDKYIAFFVGFAPAEDPRLVTIVVVDEPPAVDAYSGGKAAAPIFAKVMEQSLKVLNVAPENSSEYSVNTVFEGGANG